MTISSENKIQPTRGTVTPSYFSRSDREEKVWSRTVNSRTEREHPLLSPPERSGEGRRWLKGWVERNREPSRSCGTSLEWNPAPDAAPRALPGRPVLIPRRGRRVSLHPH